MLVIYIVHLTPPIYACIVATREFIHSDWTWERYPTVTFSTSTVSAPVTLCCMTLTKSMYASFITHLKLTTSTISSLSPLSAHYLHHQLTTSTISSLSPLSAHYLHYQLTTSTISSLPPLSASSYCFITCYYKYAWRYIALCYYIIIFPSYQIRIIISVTSKHQYYLNDE